jgi:8-oxo-dGTP pyrophosphatase MutT (NUDIX family)
MVPGVPAEAGSAEQPRAAGLRDASTTVLLRDAPGGLEAYLMVRSSRLAAFAGMTVFPGGSVDEGDFPSAAALLVSPDGSTAPLWRGPDPAEWPLTADSELSGALVVAAVRETFEEIGVLLASPADEAGGFPSDAELAADRALLEAGQVTLPGVLRSRGLVIRTDLITPWTHWITPEAEKRRFDTRFFVAELPAGQDVQEPSGEAVHALWARPEEALATVKRGELGMLPPTASTLLSLVPFGTVAEVFEAAANRIIRPIRPSYVVVDGVGRLRLPPADAELVPAEVDDEFIAELMAAISRRPR